MQEEIFGLVLPMIFKDLDEVIELANNRPWTSQCARGHVEHLKSFKDFTLVAKSQELIERMKNLYKGCFFLYCFIFYVILTCKMTTLFCERIIVSAFRKRFNISVRC
ncbi:hypothetical protein [Priestia endophytica]|uniref:hypothetical protein n=1 Tax=Priestia endophytica TaxID=135735 RepID=UPI0022825D50|nr:hypothetical protein [Priestia endophytica]MCY8235180.1 hypothetical protein [Priestia endophytica]